MQINIQNDVRNIKYLNRILGIISMELKKYPLTPEQSNNLKRHVNGLKAILSALILN